MQRKIIFSIRILIALLLVSCERTICEANKRFAVIIPSRNNSRWCERNLEALRAQTYDNWHAIYINDASTDDTREKVEQFIKKHQLEDKITLINNEERQGAMANIYKAVYMCSDSDIAMTYDGDDWFSGPHVLETLNKVYADENVWLTYGSYQDYPSGRKGDCVLPIPEEVIRSNSYRTDQWRTSHLRTFYVWLFKYIKTDDLKIDGAFFPMTYDQAIMFPMLELAAGRFKYIPDILYVYNMETAYNDNKVDPALQNKMELIIRVRPPYQPLKGIVSKNVVSNENSAVPSQWSCKYHIVFVPKGGDASLYDKVRLYLRPIFHELAHQKESKIIAVRMIHDHVHLVISIPPHHSVAEVIGYIKRRSAIAAARKFSSNQKNFNNEKLWTQGYAVSTIEFEKNQIQQYIQQQEQLDNQEFDESAAF